MNKCPYYDYGKSAPIEYGAFCSKHMIGIEKVNCKACQENNIDVTYNRFLTTEDKTLPDMDGNTLYFEQWSRPYEFKFVDQFIDKNHIVLDACCGSRYGFTHYLANRVNNVVGVDLLPAIMDLPKKDNITMIQEDIRYFQTPLKFHTIFCVSGLEHLGCSDNKGKCNTFQVFQAIKNLRTLLRPEGKIVLTIDYPVSLKSSWCGLDVRDFENMVYEAGLKFIGNVDYNIPNNALYQSTWNLHCYTAVLGK